MVSRNVGERVSSLPVSSAQPAHMCCLSDRFSLWGWSRGHLEANFELPGSWRGKGVEGRQRGECGRVSGEWEVRTLPPGTHHRLSRVPLSLSFPINKMYWNAPHGHDMWVFSEAVNIFQTVAMGTALGG